MVLSLLKKTAGWIFKIAAAITVFVGLQKLCELNTRGFSLQRILDHDLPSQAAWQTAPLEAKELQEIATLLDQPYHLLGSGGECFAFVSQDQKFVIKFYKLNLGRFMYLRHGLLKMDHGKDAGTISNHWLAQAALPSFLDIARKRILGMREHRLKRLFKSTMLAYEELKQETALLYVHLNQTEHFKKPLILIDSMGNSHHIDPNTTKFVIQCKAQPLLDRLHHLMQEGQIEAAKKSIDSFLDLIVQRCKKGFADRDIYMRNFGFVADRAMEIDIGPFVKDPQMQGNNNIKKELFFASSELRAYLAKNNYPQLLAHLEQSLSSYAIDDHD